ncbi:MAG: septum formation protein Maf [Clostridia bacterium]|nr:septum formation protein Maf [Clostridia bacterium]MBO7156015.1 septum formation protein Maf [Clostridia bacterium]
MKVLLASQSPRRKELLKTVLPEFAVESYPADERFKGVTPEETVKEIALRKLVAVENPERYDLIIASDTLVYKDGVYYGKPVDEQDAVSMLKELEGKTHVVVSGLAISYKGERECYSVSTNVTFHKMSEEDIYNYLHTHYCYDKAGAYAVQDGVVVERYEGSYTNIVGLPMEKLTEILKEKKII